MKTAERRERGSAGQHQGAVMKKGNTESHAKTRSSRRGSSWQKKPLEEVCNVEYGTRVVQKRDGGKGFPVYGGGGATFEMDVFNRGDRLVVARFGMSEECTRFVAGKFFLNDSGLTVSPKNGVMIQRFLDYQMLALNDDIYALGKGTAQKNLDVPVFRTLPLFVPESLAEQQRIVGLLDEAFEGLATAKANAEKNLQNARALFESHLQSVFTQRGPGWVEKRFDEVCAITSTLVDPRKKEFLDLTHVGAGNIESKTGVFVDLKTAREEGLISGKFLFDESMVLYSKIRPYLMKVARPDFEGLCSADMYPLSPIQNVVTRDYLFHLLLSKHFTDYAIQGSARAGMPKVNREHLFEYRVSLPDVKKQRQIAVNLDDLHEETQRLAHLSERKPAALEALKKSLLHQAFTGALE
jgi:type I restriction enzyme S subunit